jgi:hypothetical protein
VILRDGAPLGVKIGFNSDVSASLATVGAFTVRNLTTGQTVAPSSYAFTWDAATNSALFRFTSQPAKGNYTATLSGAVVANAQGTRLDGNGDGTAGGDYMLSFFHLPGDFNLDRTVGFADLVAVAQHYDQPVTRYADGDANGDGLCNFLDLVAVAQNYDSTLAPPTGAAVPAPVPAASSAPVAPVSLQNSAPALIAPTSPKGVFAAASLTKAHKPAPRAAKSVRRPQPKTPAARSAPATVNAPQAVRPPVFNARRIARNDLLQ